MKKKSKITFNSSMPKLRVQYLKDAWCIVSFIISLFLGLSGCIPFGAGTHGSIDSYHFDRNNDEIVLMVDQFLLTNPDYVDFIDSTSGYGWIHIKIPTSGNRYGFRIGGNSVINLIQASKKGEEYNYGHQLWFWQENSFKNDFKKNFIDILNQKIINKYNIAREPFTLTINKDIDTILWPEYFLTIDTTLTFPLPLEFDTLKIEYFENLVEHYSQSFETNIFINQHYHYIRLNEQCTGYLHDSIRITRFYRRIGEKFNFTTIFETKEWATLTGNTNIQNRLNAYSIIRQNKKDKNYRVSEVFTLITEELWMKKEER